MNNLKNKLSQLKFNGDNEIESLNQFDINEYKFESNSILFFSDKPEEMQNEEGNIINNFINNLNKEVNLIIQQLNQKITNLKQKVNDLDNLNKKLAEEINGDTSIDKLKKLGISIEESRLLPRQNLITIDPKTNRFIGNETTIKIDSTQFYDIIIDITSIKDIIKGWEVKKSKRAINNYDQFKKDKVLKIGVIGNSNKGKSFILSKISKVKNIPSGTSIRTEGLSIKYPELEEYKDRKIVLLDSTGLESPVINEDINNNEENKETEIKQNEVKENKKEEKNKEENKEEDKEKKEENKEKDKENNEEKKEEEKKVETPKNENSNDDKNVSIKKDERKKENNIQNEISEKKNDSSVIENIDRSFQEKSKEKLITELFLQNYIINNSDILLIVVGILTYSEQKLLYKIKNQIIKLKLNKPLFIIHNLYTLTKIEQVEDYINNYLLKSSTFTLEKGHKISTQKKIKTGVYYYEKNIEANIYHLIFANEGSEAGDYYNNLTLNFIENSYQNVINLESFDIIETIKERFVDFSKDIIENCEPLTRNDFDNTNDDYIKLINKKPITLKKVLINELGISNLISNGFEPTYNLYQKENKIFLKLEACGNSITKASIDVKKGNIIIEGIKNKDKDPKNLEDNIINKRKYGKFKLDIPLSREFILKNETPNVYEKKGIIIVEFNMDEKKKEGELIIDEKDEI